MAVNTGNTNIGSGTANINLTEALVNNQKNNSRSSNQTNVSNSIFSFTSNAPMSRNQTNGILQSWIAAFEKKLSTSVVLNREAYGVRLFEGNKHGFSISTVIFTYTGVTSEGKTFILAYPYVIQSSFEKLPNVMKKINDTMVEYDQSPSAVFNSAAYVQKIIEFLQNGDKSSEVSLTGPDFIPCDIKVEDEDFVHAATYNAVMSFQRLLQAQPNITPLFFNNTKSTIQIAVDLNPPSKIEINGFPERSNFCITNSIITQNLDRSNLYTTSDVSEGGITQYSLTNVNGYVDFEYTQPAGGVGYGQQNADTRRFVPMFVLTGIDYLKDSMPLELALMALAGLPSILNSKQWYMLFRPRAQINKRGLNKDIGDFGYVVPYPGNTSFEKIDTQNNFGDAELCRLMEMSCFEPFFGIDVPDAGPSTWLLKIFERASNGDSKAIREITNSANVLTDGLFDKYWSQNSNNNLFFEQRNTIVPLGYFITKDSVKTDIRELDSLTMLNYCGKNKKEILFNFFRIYSDTNLNPEVRLSELLKIIKMVLGPETRITGYSKRILIKPMFIKTLLKAIQDAGIVMSLNRTTTNMGSENLVSTLNMNHSFNFATNELFSNGFGVNSQTGNRGNFGSFNLFQ